MLDQRSGPKVNGHGKSDLANVLSNVHQQYAAANPNSQAAYDLSCEVMPGANTRTSIHASPFPLTIDRGHGALLYDVDGHEYIDFLGEFSAGVYGHDSPVIKKAVMEAMEKGWNFGSKNRYEDQLARALVKRFSYSMDLIRFCNSGTEANMMALGVAMDFTGKKKILVFTNGYHGSTILFLPSPHPTSTMNAPYDFLIAPTYNDIPATTAYLATHLPPDTTTTLAAILVEPMQVSGGCIPGTTQFLQHLRHLADQHHALLIFDEIMTSRLAYGELQVELGIKPDITTIGKWAGGGMSFGAFGARREVMELFDPRTGRLSHAGTFNNNVVTMAAGVAGEGVMTRERLEGLNALGGRLIGDLDDLIKAKLPRDDSAATGDVALWNGDGGGLRGGDSAAERNIFVIGRGSLFAIRFRGPNGNTLRELFYHHLLSHGIFIASRGFLALTLENTEKHCQRLLSVVEGFLEEYKEYLV